MKKTTKSYFLKTIAIVVIYTIILSLFLTINVSAEDTTSAPKQYNKNTATDYFFNLNDAYGYNKEGTCTYIAISMLLSYYDSFLDDRFVSMGYDQKGEIQHNGTMYTTLKSPGTHNEGNWLSSPNSYSTYNEFINDKYTESFHLNLIKIGRDDCNLYYPEIVHSVVDLFDNPKIYNSLYSSVDWSISMYQGKQVLEKYLSQQNLSPYVTIHYLSYLELMLTPGNNIFTPEQADTYIRQVAVDKINSGVPVVYAGFYEDQHSNEWKGHALVAYDYDSETNQIYFHTGWHNGTRIIGCGDSSFNYKDCLYLLWLEIDTDALGHNCSMNYGYGSGDNQLSLCMCSLGIHPNHKHSCTDIISYSNNDHTAHCTKCDLTYTSAHDYTYYLYNDVQHRVSCRCGYTIYLPHVITGTGIQKRCIKCGHLIGSGGILYDSLPSPVEYITDNGSYVMSNGIIYLSNVDYELFLSGELDIDSLVNNTYALF